MIINDILQLGPLLSILIISFVISLLTSIAYKYMTDQEKIKKLRKEVTEGQKKLNKLIKENPEKAMKLQKEIMSKNAEVMKQNFKPMLLTFIPLILIFGWLSNHLAYEPIRPGEQFNVTITTEPRMKGTLTLETTPPLKYYQGKKGATITTNEAKKQGEATWTLTAEKEGTYTLIINKTITKEIIISNNYGEYAPPKEQINKEGYKEIIISNKKIKPLKGAPIIGGFGWLGTYIIFSLITSIIIRKALKIQ